MMIYGSFALMVWHWLPVVVLACVWTGLFAVNMINKEASMSRYAEWANYKHAHGGCYRRSSRKRTSPSSCVTELRAASTSRASPAVIR